MEVFLSQTWNRMKYYGPCPRQAPVYCNLYSSVSNTTQNSVVRLAHCEYDNGFLIFNRAGSSKEVWRTACDFNLDETPPTSQPDQLQIRASADADARHGLPGRGHFKPWALLTMPRDTWAFRFVYPTLAVAAVTHFYLWDIPTAQLIQTIVDPEIDEHDRDLNYIEVSEQYVFVSRWEQVHVFSRASGRKVLTIDAESSMGGSPKLLFDVNLPVGSTFPPGIELQLQEASGPATLQNTHPTVSGYEFTAG